MEILKSDLPLFVNTEFILSTDLVPLNLTKIHFKADEDYNISILEKNISKENKAIDDFEEVFNLTQFKTTYLCLWTSFLLFTNPFYVAVLFYEMYGEDTMKRSINNQLISQFIVVHVTFYNLICGFIFSWRFIFGPVHFFLAAFEGY